MPFGNQVDASDVHYEISTVYQDGGNPIALRIIVDPLGAQEFGLSEQAFTDLDTLALDVANFVSTHQLINRVTSVGRRVQRTSDAVFGE